MNRSRMVRGAVVVAGLTAVAFGTAPPLALAAPGADPSAVGQWRTPFEEGGADTPRCVEEERFGNPYLICKPAAQAQFVAPNGTVMYYNGIEGQENIETGLVPELAPTSAEDRSRVLDLRDGAPTWRVPEGEQGAGINPEIQDGRTSEDCLRDDPLGVLGVPGRPGDGPVGSLAGQAGAPESNPVCSPDDPAENDVNMFCGDIAQMADGRALVIGGTDYYNEPAILERNEGDPANVGLLEVQGLRSSRIYDSTKESFSPTEGQMKFNRWYSTLTTLPDGKMLATGGVSKLVKTTQGGQVRRTETFDPATSEWTENFTGPASENSLPLNARLHLTPNGKVFYGGNGQQWNPFGQAIDEATFAIRQFFDPETAQWQQAGVGLVRDAAFSVALPMAAPYDRMDILSISGSVGPPPGAYLALPLSTVTSVTAEGTVSERQTAPVAHSRWSGSGVALPDGKVLALNGAGANELFAPNTEQPVRAVELFDPATDQWTEVAVQDRDRMYHSTAVLLPDGRVLSGGHVPAGTFYGAVRNMPEPTSQNHRDPSFNIYSPPYLFWGERPRIDEVQSGIAWGESFTVRTDEADQITKVMLMRTGSPQHANDNDPRTLELPFTVSDGKLRVDAPPNGIAAPPGYYYLFIDREEEGKGLVPSVARMVHIGEKSDSEPAVEPMNGDLTEGGSATPEPSRPGEAGYDPNFPPSLPMSGESGDEAVTAARATPSGSGRRARR
ncbi:MAG: galactose oxidase-like domain-containing protein [Pseudonocardia sp.]